MSAEETLIITKGFLRDAIMRVIVKTRKQTLHPDNGEYIDLLRETIDEIEADLALPKRGPGRPRKQPVQDVQDATWTAIVPME